MKKIRVLIADDSAMMRRTLRNIIESDPELEVVGTARDGVDAVNKARELRPDVVTMDINMPEMDGLTALQLIIDERLASVLMVSSLTQEGAETTFEAIELGAFDYVGKPGGTVSANLKSVADEIIAKIKAAASTEGAEDVYCRTDELTGPRHGEKGCCLLLAGQKGKKNRLYRGEEANQRPWP
jgi:two-component system chemotaxis response regulator CheB